MINLNKVKKIEKGLYILGFLSPVLTVLLIYVDSYRGNYDNMESEQAWVTGIILFNGIFIGIGLVVIALVMSISRVIYSKTSKSISHVP